MIQACLIRNSVSSLRNESSTEDWTQISGPFFVIVVCSLYQELMHNNYNLSYNTINTFVPRARFGKSLISYVQSKILENQIIIKSFGIT